MMHSFVCGKSRINVWHQSDLDLIQIWASVFSDICKSVGILGNIQKEFCSSVISLPVLFFSFSFSCSLCVYFSFSLPLCLLISLCVYFLPSISYFFHFFIFLIILSYYFFSSLGSYCLFLTLCPLALFFLSVSLCVFLCLVPCVFCCGSLFFFLYFLHTHPHTHHAIAQCMEKCWCRITVCGNPLCVVCV